MEYFKTFYFFSSLISKQKKKAKNKMQKTKIIQNIVAILKVNSINSTLFFLVFICKASMICSRGFSI